MAARRVVVGLVGPGLIGKALLEQLRQQTPVLLEQQGLHLAVVAIANSRRQLLSGNEQLQLSRDWATRLDGSVTPADLKALGAHVAAVRPPGGVGIVVDCSASDVVPDHYAAWLEAGLSVVTPNKKGGAGPLLRLDGALAAARLGGSQFLAEASVGAGLPVLSTLRELIETGDRVVRIEGILSGTLSFIFNTFKPGMPFSGVVAEANALGYTEPDPREDLSGMDVARKVVILARACGLPTELSHLRVDSLVPDALRDVPVEEFMERLPEFDSDIAAQADEAAAGGGVLRYVGVVDAEAGEASVTLKSFPKDHPFAQLKGTDNLFSFTTERYSANPLIIRGPGAGADVTAAGVFGDILRAARTVPPPATAKE